MDAFGQSLGDLFDSIHLFAPGWPALDRMPPNPEGGPGWDIPPTREDPAEEEAAPPSPAGGKKGPQDYLTPADAAKANVGDRRGKSILKAVKPGTCLPGERADLTHCTPQEEVPSDKLGASPAEEGKPKKPTKPKGNPAATAAGLAFAGVKATAEHTTAAASMVGKALWDKLPQKVQQGLATTYAWSKKIEHFLMSGFRKSKELAVEEGKKWGLSDEQAAKLGRVLGTADLVSAWTINMPATFAATGNPVAAKAASWVPVASLAFLAGSSTTRNAFKTVKAAREIIRSHSKTRAAKLPPSATKKGWEPNGDEKISYDKNTATAIAQKIKEVGGDGEDWYLALLHAALDQTGDLTKAKEAADAAFKENPTEPATDDVFSLAADGPANLLG